MAPVNMTRRWCTPGNDTHRQTEHGPSSNTAQQLGPFPAEYVREDRSGHVEDAQYSRQARNCQPYCHGPLSHPRRNTWTVGSHQCMLQTSFDYKANHAVAGQHMTDEGN